MMKRLLSAFGGALLLWSALAGPTSAQNTKASNTSDINTNWADNTTGAITPAISRTTLLRLVNSMQQYAGVNAQTGTTYTVLVGDYGQLVTFNNAGAIAVTLPQATGSFATFNTYVRNLGAGTVTITPTTSTINGAATLVLTTGQAAWIVSDGTNYQTWFTGAIACAGLPALTGDVTSSGCATTLATAQSGAHTWSAINTFSNATAATSASTGAIVVLTGGIGVGGAVWANNLIADSGIQAPNYIITNIATLTNIAAPASPAAGTIVIYGSSANLRFNDKNAAGTIGTTVVASTCAANNFATGVSVGGVISCAQPSFSNISGTIATGQVSGSYTGITGVGTLTAGATGAGFTIALTTSTVTGTLPAAQLPALTGDVTTSAGSLATTLATVNSNVGTFGSATQASQITVNAKGLVTAAANVTLTPAVGSITGLGAGVGTFLATPSSANLAAALTDETGTGAAVFATGPTLVAPILGAATATSMKTASIFPPSDGTSALQIYTSGGTTAVVVVDTTNARLSIINSGVTVVPDSALTIMGNTAATVAPLATTYLHVVGADSANPRITVDSFGGIPIFQARRADGTLASKSAVASGVQVFNFSPQTWGGSTYSGIGSIQFTTTELQSETARGGKIVFTVVANTTTAGVTALTIDQDKSITVAGATASTSKTTGSGIFGGGIGVAGATYTDTLNIITVANASTTRALCWDNTTGLVSENGTVGTCTVSLLAAKNLTAPLTPEEGYAIIMALQPWRYTMKEGLPSYVVGEQIGFVVDYAAQVEIAKPLVARNNDGTLAGFRYENTTAALTGAFKYHDAKMVALEAANDNLRIEIEQLKRRVR